MSTLSATDLSFLTKHLAVETKPRGFWKKRNTDQKKNDELKKAFADYQRREQKVIEEVGKLRSVGTVEATGLADKYTTQITDAQKELKKAPLNDPAKAKAALDTAYVSLEKVKKEVRKDVAALASSDQENEAAYNKELLRAEEVRKKLALENRSERTFDDPIKTLVADAKKLGDKRDFVNALAALAPLDHTFQLQMAKVKQQRTRDLEDAQWRKVYEDKLTRMQNGLAELQKLPGTKDQCRTLQVAMKNAGGKIAKEGFKAAYNELTGLGDKFYGSGALTAGKESAENFKKTAGDANFQKAVKAAEDELKRLSGLADLAQPEIVKGHRKTIDDLLLDLDRKGGAAPTVAMQKCADDVKKEADTLEGVQKQCVDLLDTDGVAKGDSGLRKVVNVVLLEQLTPAACAPVSDALRGAEALFNAQQYDKALTALQDVKQRAIGALASAKKPFEDWQSLVKTVTAKRALLEEVAKAWVPDLAQEARDVLLTFRKVEEEARKTHDYAEVLKHADIVAAMIVGIEDEWKTYDPLKTKIDTALGVWGKKSQDVEAKIAKLEKDGADGTPFRSSLSVAGKLWQEKVKTVLADPQNATDFDGDASAALTELERIITAVNELSADKARLANSKKTATANKEKDQLKQEKEEAAKLLRQLQEDDLGEIDKLLGPPKVDFTAELTKLENEEDLAKLKLEVPKLQKAIADRAKEVDDKLKEERAKIQTTAKEIEKLVVKLEKSNKKYAAAWKKYRDAINDCLGMADSTLLTAVQKAATEMDKLKIEVQQAVTDNDPKKPTAGKNVAEVEKKLAEFKTKFETAELKECLPGKLKVLQLRLKKEYKPDARKATPEAALKLLAPFEQDLDTAIADAKVAKGLRDELIEKAKELRGQLQGLPPDAPKLKAGFEKRIESALKPKEGGETMADLQLTAMKRELADALASPGKRNALERRAHEEEFKVEKDKAAWKATLAVFEKNTKRKVEAAYNKTNKKARNQARYEQIIHLYDEAKKAADKDDFVSAREGLLEARRFARMFLKNPEGGKALARSQLVKVNKLWKAAVADLIKAALADLPAAVKKEATPADVDKPLAELDAAAKLFDAGRFEEPIKKIINPKTDLTALRKLKRETLQDVRAFKAVVKGDPLLAHLDANPFGVDLPLAALEEALWNLEINLLRA